MGFVLSSIWRVYQWYIVIPFLGFRQRPNSIIRRTYVRKIEVIDILVIPPRVKIKACNSPSSSINTGGGASGFELESRCGFDVDTTSLSSLSFCSFFSVCFDSDGLNFLNDGSGQVGPRGS